jgi:hypothetical protein
MTVPEFAAEASFYKTTIHYSLAANRAHVAGNPGIYPARVVCEPDCTCDTYDFGVPGQCAKLCFETPYGEPYPVLCKPGQCNPRCDQPICGACTKTCQYPSSPPYTQNC